MVVQYPSILKFRPLLFKSVYNQDTGLYSETTSGDYTQLSCREEMNSKGDVVASNDGSQLEYSYTVYMQKDVPLFEFGQIVEVHNSDGLLIKASVKKFSRGQLNARLWV